MRELEFYRVYSDALKKQYGEKVYKIPINLDVTCPNRDGNLGFGGCIYCGDMGAGHEALDCKLSVKDQFDLNSKYIQKRYNAKKFITYYQNFSNTYLPLAQFEQFMYEGICENVVGLSISTRPDCIRLDYLDILKKIEKEHNIEIDIELGLQSINHKTLDIINRGHSLAEFIDAVLMIKQYGFKICTHLIIDLPWDELEDTIEAAKILSAMKVDSIKLHSLYIVKGTLLEKMYKNNELKLLSKEDYIKRAIEFLLYLDENIIIQRLIGRAPEKDTITANWNTSWWKIKDELLDYMEDNNLKQGQKCDYLGGKALKRY